MGEREFTLLKNYDSPTLRIYKGVSKKESEWLEIFTYLKAGDCDIKKDWFLDTKLAPSNQKNKIKVINKISIDRINYSKNLIKGINSSRKEIEEINNKITNISYNTLIDICINLCERIEILENK